MVRHVKYLPCDQRRRLSCRWTRRLLELGTHNSPHIPGKYDISTVRREAATTLLRQFLSSRTIGGAVGMATAQPRDILQVLCWLYSCRNNRRRTVVHAMHCIRYTGKLRNFPVAQPNLENVQSGTLTIS